MGLDPPKRRWAAGTRILLRRTFLSSSRVRVHRRLAVPSCLEIRSSRLVMKPGLPPPAPPRALAEPESARERRRYHGGVAKSATPGTRRRPARPPVRGTGTTTARATPATSSEMARGLARGSTERSQTPPARRTPVLDRAEHERPAAFSCAPAFPHRVLRSRQWFADFLRDRDGEVISEQTAGPSARPPADTTTGAGAAENDPTAREIDFMKKNRRGSGTYSPNGTRWTLR